MRARHHLVVIMGHGYLMTRAAMIRYLKARLRGECLDPGPGWTRLGEVLNWTDLDEEETADILKGMLP